jgi:endonuclease YncB( thermonuclease family)
MSDLIQGPVTRIIDGDTFEMRVTPTGTNNRNQYNNTETIRIAGFNAPELPSRAGQRSKDALAQKLSGKTVHCTVQARDTYGRVVATVRVL